ncbi:DEAD/DEAH box helicase [Bacillus sp. Gen3]|nr:DEAD/DEAH box helicase [Bacillus sp. Gen3]
MNLKLNPKIIKDMCGTVSFKRGEGFFRTNKITFEKFNSNEFIAKVAGVDDFLVTIVKDADGEIRTQCSCPKLASFQKECQHIAAVLLSIYEYQRQGKTPFQSIQPMDSENQGITEGILTLFDDVPKRSSGHQLYFENRQVIDADFICKPVLIGDGKYIFGIQLKIGLIKIQDIRNFLMRVKEGMSIFLSDTFTYDPSIHCFRKETDLVIQQLIQVIQDEKAFQKSIMDSINESLDNDLLLIPPSSWETLVPLLKNLPYVHLHHQGKIFKGLQVSLEPLPIRYDFAENDRSGYILKIQGLKRIMVFELYGYALYDGILVRLESEDCHRLLYLKQLLDSSRTNQITIPLEQKEIFLNKVVPGLKRIGNVNISPSISRQLVQIPLVAKLYLDRVKNRLLAGLEFHYENMVINPLENRELPSGAMIRRDIEKENEILQLMEESSFAKTDGGYFLHNEELEYDFLYYMIPKLEKIVQIYATTAVRNRIFKGNTPPKIRIKMKKERKNWLEFKFEMDGIPEKHIRDILLALEEKRKYYRLRNGSLLSLETREFEEIQRFLQALPIQNEDMEGSFNVPIVQGLRALDSVEEGPSFELEDTFRQFLETIQSPGSMEFEVPKELQSVLRDYQVQGYQWMKTLASYGFGGILADDMGLGKTLQSISFIQSELSEIRQKQHPALIICPSSLTYNWLSEIMTFTPQIQAIVIDGNKKERLHLQKELTGIDVLITSYPLLRRDIKWFEKQQFHTVFFDEAQAFKNPFTQTARAVKKIMADYRFALTGTPVENSLEELWSIFHVVFPDLFQGLKEYNNLSRKVIAKRIRPFLLRRLKEDVLSELPGKVESMESIELLPEQKKLYAAYLAKLRHDTLKHLDRDTIRKNRIKILAGLTRLRQICCHPALFVDGYKGTSSKFEQLKQIIKESMLSRRRVLIFSQFTKMLHLIGSELVAQGLPYFYLDGKTPSEERVELCRRFNSGERDIFLISLKAGGTGLNLAGADTVILYDLWWNPAVEEQAADRAHRMGQTNEVQVIKMISRGTIEEKMNELQTEKRHLIEEIIDPNKNSSFTLTENDIREILMI